MRYYSHDSNNREISTHISVPYSLLARRHTSRKTIYQSTRRSRLNGIATARAIALWRHLTSISDLLRMKTRRDRNNVLHSDRIRLCLLTVIIYTRLTRIKSSILQQLGQRLILHLLNMNLRDIPRSLLLIIIDRSNIGRMIHLGMKSSSLISSNVIRILPTRMIITLNIRRLRSAILRLRRYNVRNTATRIRRRPRAVLALYHRTVYRHYYSKLLRRLTLHRTHRIYHLRYHHVLISNRLHQCNSSHHDSVLIRSGQLRNLRCLYQRLLKKRKLIRVTAVMPHINTRHALRLSMHIQYFLTP